MCSVELHSAVSHFTGSCHLRQLATKGIRLSLIQFVSFAVQPLDVIIIPRLSCHAIHCCENVTQTDTKSKVVSVSMETALGGTI